MAFDFNKLQLSLKKTPKKEKTLYGLALATLVAVFLPWMKMPFFGSISGFHSAGYLTFLGSLAYLLWKLLPMAGVKLPNFGITDDLLTKILAGMMVAGPVVWIIQSGFALSVFGIGLWIALVTSAVFAYTIFSGK